MGISSKLKCVVSHIRKYDVLTLRLLENVQLNVKEALELCRYEWMQRALEDFLRVMEDEGRLTTEEEPVQDSSKLEEECQIDPWYCFVVN